MFSFRLWLLPFLLSFVVISAWSDPLSQPKLPRISAPIYLLMDAQSGRILVNYKGDEPHPPASLAKMMTAYIVESYLQRGRISMEDKVLISKVAWKTGGSRTFLKVGSKVPIKDLLLGLLVQSGNDAATALAEHLATSSEDFAERFMNPVARQMGMNHTTFKNATGLPEEGMLTTAKDIAKLAARTISDHPELYKLYRIKTFTYNKIKQSNRNTLLWLDESVDGIKTGHSDEAGYQLVSSAKRKGMRLIAVIMGASSHQNRISDSQRLLDFGFRYYISKHLYPPMTTIHSARVWFGNENQLSIGTKRAVVVTTLSENRTRLKPILVLKTPLKAPIRKGQVVGSLKIKQGHTLLNTYPVIALQDIEEGNIFKKAWDSVFRIFY